MSHDNQWFFSHQERIPPSKKNGRHQARLRKTTLHFAWLIVDDKLQGSKNRSPRRHLATCSAALATRKKSRSPSQGSPQSRYCRLAFDFPGFDENLVAFCLLECFAGFTFLPADGHSASLKLNQRDETFSFPSYFLLNRATRDPRVACKCATRASRPAIHGVVSAREFRRSVTTLNRARERETTTEAASMRVKSRASDAECPEALQVSVLHALAISQLVDEWLANYSKTCLKRPPV